MDGTASPEAGGRVNDYIGLPDDRGCDAEQLSRKAWVMGERFPHLNGESRDEGAGFAS